MNFDPKYDPAMRRAVLSFLRKYEERKSRSRSQLPRWTKSAVEDPSFPNRFKHRLDYDLWINSGGEPVGRSRFRFEKHKWFMDFDSMQCSHCGATSNKGAGPRWPFSPYYYRLKYHIIEYPKWCCNECSKSSKETLQKKRLTSLKNWGYTNVAKSPDVQKKMQDTSLARYGYANAGMKGSPGSKKKRRTLMRRYGVDNPMKLESVVERTRQTHLRNGGNPLQRPDVFHKVMRSLHAQKEVIVDGKRFDGLMGAEPGALRLLARTFPVDRLSTAKQSGITFPYRDGGKERKYFPDLCVLRYGKPRIVVEVKSVYTLGLFGNYLNVPGRKRFANTRNKSKAVVNHGYEFWLVIPAGRRLFVWKGPLTTLRVFRNAWKAFVGGSDE